MTNLLRLLYVSQAEPTVNEDDLFAILVVSREHNRSADISGALCYRRTYFAQVLEGPELAVLETYVRIAGDDRHRDPTLITIAPVAERIYTGWFMAAVRDEDMASLGAADLLAFREQAQRDDEARRMMGRWLDLLATA
jgi:hypothetical protein